jgi:hypothetical protein
VGNGPGPDDDCAFNPSLSKCKATCDANNFCQCPKGFSMNEDDNCFPDKSCPKGFERHNEDETGKCFPITTCPPGQHFDPKVNKCAPDVITCPKGQHYDTNLKKCVPDNCPKDQHFDSKLNKCVPNPPCKKDERYDAVQDKCVPICPDGTEPLNGKCPTKTLSLSISIDKDPIVRGNKQTITVKVSDKNLHQRVSGANVQGEVHYASGSVDNGGKFSGSTDNNGVISHTWPISGSAIPGKFTANVHASKDGYKLASGSASFTVKSAISSGGGTGGGGEGGHNHVVQPAAAQQVKYLREFTDMPSNSPLYITYTSMHKDTLNDIIITGEIRNRGTNTANFVELIATFYNINNQTIGNENTFTKPSTLQPGQAAPFTMYLSPKDMPLSQVKSVKYHLSWKYTGSSSTHSLTSPLPASKALIPHTSS